MTPIEQHQVEASQPLSTALTLMGIAGHLRTLFVTDPNGRVVGTLSDGDIRRGLLKGLSAQDPCSAFAFTAFRSLRKGQIDVRQLQSYREKDICIFPLLDEQDRLERIIDLNDLRSYLPVTAVIMAGGLGQRLRPLTLETPKPMLPVGGVPILEINIKRLVRYGIREIFLCVGYKKEQIMNHFQDGSAWDCHIHYIEESQPLGTMGALAYLPEELEHEQILLFNADLLSDLDLESFYLKHQDQGNALTVASIPYKVKVPYAILEQDHDRVKAFVEKPTYTYFANAGFYLLHQQDLGRIPKAELFNATDFMDALIADKAKVGTYPILGYWSDIGSLSDYEKAQSDVPNLHLY